MSERTALPRRKPILRVANPDDERPRPPPQYNPPPPLPGITRPPAPYVDTGNLPFGDSQPSSYANPPNSSSSTNSSPLTGSTPPPSTPGINNSDGNEDSSISIAIHPSRSDISINGSAMSRGPLPSVGVSVSQFPRPGPSSNDVNTSPLSIRRPPPERVEKMLIVVTTDSENYNAVDITGASDGAFIKERIFTKLRVSDEDQSDYSIYRTKIGQYAEGEALDNDDLLNLCRSQGKVDGSPLAFFVSHSSAVVHEDLPYQDPPPVTSPTVNTIPPPVLPYVPYGPLKPRHRSGSQHGSLSSASERQPHEASVGYDASISDDFEHMVEKDANRATLRPMASSQVSLSTSLPPTCNVRSNNGRPPSPVTQISQIYAMPQKITRSAAHLDRYGVMQKSPPPAASPSYPSFPTGEGSSVKPLHIRTKSDAAGDRDRDPGMTNVKERDWQPTASGTIASVFNATIFDDSSTFPRDFQREPQREDHRSDRRHGERPGDSPNRPIPADPPGSARQVNGSRRPTTPVDGFRTSPTATRLPTRRDPEYSPIPYTSPKSSSSSRRPQIPTAPNKPVPTPPSAKQPVGKGWAVAWRLDDKNESRSPASPQSPSISMQRMHAAKSMDNLRAAFHNPQHPASLQPGASKTRRLPLATPSTSNLREHALASPTSRGNPNIPPLPIQGPIMRGSHNGVHPLPRPPAMQTSLSSADTSTTPSQYLTRGGGYGTSIQGTLVSSQDPYPRPRSAFGDSQVSPTSSTYNRPVTSPSHQRPDGNSLDSDSYRSPYPLSPHHIGFAPTSRSYRDESSRLTLNHTLKLSLGNYSSRSPDSHTTPKSPHSPLSPRYSTSSYSDAGSTSDLSKTEGFRSASSATDTDKSEASTLKPAEQTRLARLLENQSSESTLMPSESETMVNSKAPSPQPPIPTSQSLPQFPKESETLVSSGGADNDNDSDGSDGDGDLWSVPMKQRASSIMRPKSILRVKTKAADSPTSTRSSSRVQLPPLPPAPTEPPPMPSSSTSSSTPRTKNPAHRQSIFQEMRAVTWANRPPPEEMLDRLEDLFPEHDIDKPLLDANSGGTSPTLADHPPVPPPPSDKGDKGRIRGKKSIRHVAAEHRNRVDRNSRSDSSTMTPAVARKRSTKLWGSRLEEVTPGQGKSLISSVPDSPTSSGPKPIFRWVRGELIGKGTYGRVYLALNATTGEMIAVKQVEIPRTASDKSDSRQITVVEALKSESETLKDLDHPNIVQYLGYEESPLHVSIFLEYVPGGSVGSCLRKYGKFDEDVTKSFASQILAGLEYLHSKNILHRDLKADNILVEHSGVCKISDFGISRRTDDMDRSAMTAMQGSIFWMAPEVISTREKGYNTKIDIWSVGCVVLEMWAGERPWSEEEAVAVMVKLYQNKLPPPVPPNIVLGPDALDFRNKCFATNPEDRPSAAELRKHRYLELPPGWQFLGFT